jgi:hypothetical protein
VPPHPGPVTPTPPLPGRADIPIVEHHTVRMRVGEELNTMEATADMKS